MRNLESLKKNEPMTEENNKREGFISYFFAFLTGQIIQQINLRKTAPLILYIALMALFIIGNTYYGQKQVSKIENLQKDIKELRFKHTVTKSELMELTKQSTLEKQLKNRGLQISKEPPRKISIHSTE